MKVLLLRAGALGDLLLLRRAIASLQTQGARVGLVAPLPQAEALKGEGRGEVQEILAWEDRAFARLASGEWPHDSPTAERLRTYDTAIAYTANASLVAGLQRWIPVVMSHAPAPLEPGIHASITLAGVALALGGVADVEPPILQTRLEDRAVVDEWRQRLGGPGFLAVHPGSGSRLKNWPGQRFAELADALALGRPLLVVEGPADAEAVGSLRSRATAVFARGLPLRTLGAILADASLYVGNDSGVSHLAAACGARTLALFGPTDATVWAPTGPRVRVVEAPGGELERLDTAAVVAAAGDALRSWGPAALPSG